MARLKRMSVLGCHASSFEQGPVLYLLIHRPRDFGVRNSAKNIPLQPWLDLTRG